MSMEKSLKTGFKPKQILRDQKTNKEKRFYFNIIILERANSCFLNA